MTTGPSSERPSPEPPSEPSTSSGTSPSATPPSGGLRQRVAQTAQTEAERQIAPVLTELSQTVRLLGERVRELNAATERNAAVLRRVTVLRVSLIVALIFSGLLGGVATVLLLELRTYLHRPGNLLGPDSGAVQPVDTTATGWPSSARPSAVT